MVGLKVRGRNEPCWCGSAKKFKHCHLKRSDQEPDNPWDAVEANRKAFSQKKCYAEGKGLGECQGNIIRAHSVSRGANLSRIAKSGHVMQYTADIAAMNKNGGKISAKKVGIKDASTFYGFCAAHDRDLFSSVETEPFTGRPDQCLAIAYRTVSRELYGKDAAAQMPEILRGADKGRPLEQQMHLQRWIEASNWANEAARRDLRATQSALSAAIISGSNDAFDSLVLSFAAPLPFMFAGAWSPFRDLNGHDLQNGLSSRNLEQVMASSFATDVGSVVCLSWRVIDNAPGRRIAEQIAAVLPDRQASACLQVIASQVENIFFQPDWFAGLGTLQRMKLDALISGFTDMLGASRPATIVPDMDFGLPPCSGASWSA